MVSLPHVASGKVREIYAVDGDRLLFVATDRISAYDVILPDPIPDKGKLLTTLSLFWFDYLKDAMPNHLITADVAKMGLGLEMHAAMLAGRSMLVKRAEIFPIECVVRGYITGSGWKFLIDGGNQSH